MSPSERARRLVSIVGLVLVATLAGCVEVSLQEAQEPMDYDPIVYEATRKPTDGSVWRGGTQSGSFLFFDEKASTVGDLVTVVIVEQTQAQGDATTETESERVLNSSISSDVGLDNLITKPIKGLLGLLGFGDSDGNAPGEPVNIATSSTRNDFRGEGTTSRSGRFTGVVTCRVVGVLPNGILHVRGRRSVVINHEAQYISLEGLVRREDLSIDNQVLSNSVAEMRLAYDGIGVLDDKQRPGWMSRVIDWVYPF